ncbi:M56 family metallopeptidase [Winogradskyella vidalii]|uniref:M56 family metallopeptidase n=1 Tax=Winogradskyella vidalii TaxID=2615024 RepID=UPI0015CE1FD2|nr:M56 family metallopeptidase [Winogradskyella vidalii]
MAYFLKASIVIGIFYLCFLVFLKRETFFQHNRWFLIIGLVIALLFPFIVIPIYIPIEPVTINESIFTTSTTTSNFTNTQPETVFDWYQLILIIYGVGLIVFFMQFLLQFGSLMVLLLKNKKQKENQYTYVIVPNKISPFSFFKWIVYNPDTYKNQDLQLILTHEKVHVDQLHSTDILFTQLGCILFWFHPLIWLYRKEVRQNLEYIADSKTQKLSKTKKQYQHLLLKTSVANHDMSLSNNFYNSSIKKRILMLNKSRSNNKNQWKFLLVLPLLAGLLLSMNTKNIYVETNKAEITSKEITQFVVTKNTTDTELSAMSRAIERKGGSLVFSKIYRNDANELASIFLKLNNHSYGVSTSKSAIDAFIIYKEWFGDKGGYVGRIEGATLQFDNKENIKNKSTIEALTKRAINAILETGIQDEEDLKRFQQLQHKSKEKTNKGQKQLKDSIVSESIKIKFTNQMSDERINDVKTLLKSKGVNMEIKHLKRNQNHLISSIDIVFESKKGTAKHSATIEKGILPFYFEMSDTNYGVITIQKSEHIEETLMVYETEQPTDTLYYRLIDSSAVQRLSKEKSDYYYEDGKTIKINKLNEEITVHQPEMIYKNIQKQTYNTPKPLIIVNGSPVASAYLKSINPDVIKSMTVLKGEDAISAYGEKGKHGVIQLITKDSSTEKNYNSKKDDLSKIRTEVTHLTFTDDEDPSKNANIAYISKFTTDKILDSHKTNFKAAGITVKYSKLKRNKSGEITSIKISLSDGDGKKSSSSWKVNDGIPNIEFGKYEDALIARTKQP